MQRLGDSLTIPGAQKPPPSHRPGSYGLDQGCLPHLLDAAKMLSHVWLGQVSNTTILRCFLSTKLFSPAQEAELQELVRASLPEHPESRSVLRLCKSIERLTLSCPAPGTESACGVNHKVVHAVDEARKFLRAIAEDPRPTAAEESMLNWFLSEDDLGVQQAEMMEAALAFVDGVNGDAAGAAVDAEGEPLEDAGALPPLVLPGYDDEPAPPRQVDAPRQADASVVRDAAPVEAGAAVVAAAPTVENVRGMLESFCVARDPAVDVHTLSTQQLCSMFQSCLSVDPSVSRP